MPITLAEIRPGAYSDSVVLMQLQRALADLPGVADAGVMMGTPANKELLARSGLLIDATQQAGPDDLVIVVQAQDEATCQEALAQVDDLLARRRAQTSSTYRPKTLDAAAKMAPDARWVLISVPGRYAADVARQALRLDRNVFLYSDNVALEDEIELKRTAAAQGLLVMGPDCGTAIIDGMGLGFANRVRRGKIGVVAASGTGLQAVAVGIHQLGGGISQAYGTGGRDLSEQVGGLTARQCLARLAADPETGVIVLVSKPPSPGVAEELLAAAQASGKPVVVDFLGLSGETAAPPGVHFARTLNEAAALAVALAADGGTPPESASPLRPTLPAPAPEKSLRGLYSGGTLAYEALWLLQEALPTIHSNAPLPGAPKLANPQRSQGHTIVDLGGDEFTVGRLHPMLDNDLRIRRLLDEAGDPDVGVILLDVVLGDGAHPDPAGELAPAIQEARAIAARAGRDLAVVAAVIGTDRDPQGLASQVERLQAPGALVFTRHDAAVHAALALLSTQSPPPRPPTGHQSPIPQSPSPSTPAFAAINVGLESFRDSLHAQGADVVQVDWRPPAGGNERLMDILAKMKGR